MTNDSHLITKKWLEEPTNGGDSCNLFQLIEEKNTDIIPRELLTEELVTKPRNKEGETALHIAAKHDQIKNFPRNLLTEENLLIRTDNGELTPLTALCWGGNFESIPKKILEKNLFLELTSTGVTPFLEMAWHGKIPPKFLTEENLLKKDKQNRNAVHYAAEGRNLHKIPRERIKTEWLLRSYPLPGGNSSQTALEYVIQLRTEVGYAFSAISARECTKFIDKIKEIAATYKQCPELNMLIKETETLQKIGDIPSLRIRKKKNLRDTNFLSLNVI